MVAVNKELGTYLAAVALVSLGMYVHVLLFNLYLADLSFREDLMGRLSGAMALGTALGTLPAAALARRAGLRSTILISLGGSPAPVTKSLSLRQPDYICFLVSEQTKKDIRTVMGSKISALSVTICQARRRSSV